MSELSIEDIKSYMQGKERHSIMTVKDINDPDYKTMRKLVLDIRPDTEDYIYNITGVMNTLLSSLRHMEPNDYNKIANTFKKYEVRGTHNGIRGTKSYGYDRSRIDGAMIRRKRGN
tara:strand:+ start:142 stop:489 length:348 start_codon:yes stop_codon:yes gene_type:complete